MLEFQISAVTNFQMDLLFLGRGGHGAEGAGAGKEGPLRKEGATDTLPCWLILSGCHTFQSARLAYSNHSVKTHYLGINQIAS